MFHVISIVLLISPTLEYDCYAVKCASKPSNPDICSPTYIACDNALHKCAHNSLGNATCVTDGGPGEGE